MYNSIRKWFNEQQTRRGEAEMSFRFTGKESRNYLDNFPNLLLLCLTNMNNINAQQKIIQAHEQSLLLRTLISYSVRVENFDSVDLDSENGC